MASPEITLTHLDEPLFDGADATKRDLVDYLEAVADRIVCVLSGRPLSVIRVRAGQRPFMQKNVPDYAPPWIKTVSMWAESSHREVRYALCEDKPTLIWFANQRAVEYHVTLGTAGHLDRPSCLVLDIDPPAATRALAERAARLDPGLATTAFIKADRGGMVFIDSTRAHGATVVAAYSPRARPGVPVSFPVAWDWLDQVSPGDFTVRNAARLLAGADPWAAALPPPQALPEDLVAEGHAIPVARVQAMHEGKRRARARRGSPHAAG